jgi:Ca-activated chloride channel homolog
MVTPSVRLTVTAMLLYAATSAGQGPVRRSGPATLRVDVNLVLVPVTVTDRNGKILSGLDRSRFKVLDEGVPQPIVSFSTEDLPASIGLVLDVSGSMKQKLATARSFVRLLLGATDPGDEALFLTCADRPDVQTDLTHNIDRLQKILETSRPGGWTALDDSIYMTIDRMKLARNSRKVLVIVSDGQDNRSRYSQRELMSKAVESEAQIYTVALHEAPGSRKAIELGEANRGLALLSDLAKATGGLYFQIDSDASISDAARKISLALHHQYLIGYYSPEPLRNGPRRIQVKLDVPDARLYTRNRYYTTSP